MGQQGREERITECTMSMTALILIRSGHWSKGYCSKYVILSDDISGLFFFFYCVTPKLLDFVFKRV